MSFASSSWCFAGLSLLGPIRWFFRQLIGFLCRWCRTFFADWCLPIGASFAASDLHHWGCPALCFNRWFVPFLVSFASSSWCFAGLSLLGPIHAFFASWYLVLVMSSSSGLSFLSLCRPSWCLFSLIFATVQLSIVLFFFFLLSVLCLCSTNPFQVQNRLLDTFAVGAEFVSRYVWHFIRRSTCCAHVFRFSCLTLICLVVRNLS